MECKVSCDITPCYGGSHWNISRMECKAFLLSEMSAIASIGIYPEWNVKKRTAYEIRRNDNIGIYPEWNVKVDIFQMLHLMCPIGIYPEWNVKYGNIKYIYL